MWFIAQMEWGKGRQDHKTEVLVFDLEEPLMRFILSHCGIYLGFFQSAWVTQEYKPHWVSTPNISFSENPPGNQYIHMCIFICMDTKWVIREMNFMSIYENKKKYKIYKNIQIKLYD